MGVAANVFEVQLSLGIGMYRWNESFAEKLNEQYSTLSESETMESLRVELAIRYAPEKDGELDAGEIEEGNPAVNGDYRNVIPEELRGIIKR